MGIPRFDIPPTSRPQFPTGPPKQRTTALNEEFWQRCDEAEVVRLISVFQEEVESVYPCLDTEYMVAEAADILTWGRVREDSAHADAPVEVQHLSFKDFQLAKVAIATAIVIEANGRNENSTLMVDSVERRVSRILKPKCDLKDLQLLVILHGGPSA
ncbi:hypothetical protein SEUCBS140593_003105 [Sporothrix eucalyptigena]|uniref:Uncharacterized protein n=1 Tax=Sporothrix eucalyptigena TaxID=1812306 RepID=A0ABP0BD86_9PEZI